MVPRARSALFVLALSSNNLLELLSRAQTVLVPTRNSGAHYGHVRPRHRIFSQGS